MKCPDEGCVNTDKEIWRKVTDDYYSPSIHITQGGGVGINVGGYVIVKPIEEWHRMAHNTEQPSQECPWYGKDWTRKCPMTGKPQAEASAMPKRLSESKLTDIIIMALKDKGGCLGLMKTQIGPVAVWIAKALIEAQDKV